MNKKTIAIILLVILSLILSLMLYTEKKERVIEIEYLNLKYSYDQLTMLPNIMIDLLDSLESSVEFKEWKKDYVNIERISLFDDELNNQWQEITNLILLSLNTLESDPDDVNRGELTKKLSFFKDEMASILYTDKIKGSMSKKEASQIRRDDLNKIFKQLNDALQEYLNEHS